jgi:hypothetical protein
MSSIYASTAREETRDYIGAALGVRGSATVNLLVAFFEFLEADHIL